MKRTLDHSAVADYSRTFSERALREAYADQSKLSGQDILSMSPVKQVNFFVIRALFDQWQQEMDRLKSPYFDYQNEEVQLALEEFMNTLSQHISVAEAELKPLTEAAVRDTLVLLLSPADYYEQSLEQHGDQPWYAEDVKAWIKYVKIHREPLERLLARAEAVGGKQLASDEAQSLLHQALDELSLSDPTDALRQFASVAPVTAEDLYEVSAPEEPAEAPPAEPEEMSEYDHEVEEPSAMPLAEGNEAKIASLRTLNDELNAGQKATLADLHRQQKIANIKSYIGVNQRFMFIRELFNNNADEYNRALDELEQKNTYIEAFNHLRNEYAQPHRWKMDSEEVVEFLEIVAKRF